MQPRINVRYFALAGSLVLGAGVGTVALGSVLSEGSTSSATPPALRFAPDQADVVLEIPPRVGDLVDLSSARLAGATGRGRVVFVALGASENAGKVCVFTANATGATAVVPVVCDPPARAAERGLDLEEALPDGSMHGVHVRVPSEGKPIVRIFGVKSEGGTVDIRSGDRTVRLDFGDLSAANARADRELELRAAERSGP